MGYNQQIALKNKVIAEIINKDLSNGRHLQTKIKIKLARAGKCPFNICKDLEASKLTK